MTDPFNTGDIAANWGKIDASPGPFICTSATRPAWGSQNKGQQIIETDSGLTWYWNGTAFVKTVGAGLLQTTAGASAYGTRSADISNTTNSFVVAVAVTGVVVPPGTRPLKITSSWAYTETSSVDYMAMALYRSSVGNSGQIERQWNISGSTSPGYQYYQTNLYRSNGMTVSAVIPAGLPSGTYDWSLQFRNYGTNTAYVYSTLREDASRSQPMEIYVEEM